MRKKTEFEKLLILDAATNRRNKMKAFDQMLRAWHGGVQNGAMYALRLFRKHKKDGRL
jgi:hypothetical protein